MRSRLPPCCAGKVQFEFCPYLLWPLKQAACSERSFKLLWPIWEYVMFQTHDLIRAFKTGASSSLYDDSGHCERLEKFAMDLGFKNYHAFRQTIAGQRADKIGAISVGVMRKICARRGTSKNSNYFEFQVLPSGIGFYSHWIGWDSNGEEVRVPRPTGGDFRLDMLRDNLRRPVYVVETELEATAWRQLWQSSALIEARVARQLFPSSFNKLHFVSTIPPYHRICRRERYSDNLALV